MSVMVEFCESNLSAGTEEVRLRLLENPEIDVEVMEYGCLSHCELCLLHPYALVGGEVVVGENPDDLYEKILEAVKKKEEEDEMWKKLGF